MINSYYKKMTLALVAGILAAAPALARQEVPAPAAPPKSEATVSKERAELNELREKQRELSRQLSEVNRKIAAENRKSATISRLRLDSTRLKITRLYSDSLRKKLTTGRIASVGRLSGLGPLNFNFDSGIPQNYKGIEKGKTYSKSYSVTANDALAVSNQYGKVTVQTWDKKEVKVDVDIKAYDGSDEDAQKLLDGVRIEDSHNGGVVSFKTVIDRPKSSNWWTRTVNGKTERRGVQVNYTVYMPAKITLDVTNMYGSVVLPDLNGLLKAKVSYGSLKGGKLTNPGNQIKASYSGVTIESIGSGNVAVEYGRADIGTADNINLNLSYSSNGRIGKLINGGDLKLAYSGGFKIEQLAPQFKTMTVISTYSPKFTINAGTSNFDFDVSVNYASFDYKGNEKVNITTTSPSDPARGWSSTRVYKGQFGKSSDSKVTIKANYGSVQFL